MHHWEHTTAEVDDEEVVPYMRNIQPMVQVVN